MLFDGVAQGVSVALCHCQHGCFLVQVAGLEYEVNLLHRGLCGEFPDSAHIQSGVGLYAAGSGGGGVAAQFVKQSLPGSRQAGEVGMIAGNDGIGLGGLGADQDIYV